ncbi:MAG TPA: ABC transporter permease, partial [Bryobacteraceae bacterium]|nr:ABC transporter permease [Bryobacteraceae bacterium]
MFSDLIRGARARIRAIRYKADDARVLDEELQFHLEQLASRFEGQGLPLEEARRRARIELGAAAAIQETCRDTTGANWITDAVRDGALALRNLRREPVFSLAAIFTLTLGIGVNTTLFTAMYSVVFRPLPVANAGSLRNVYQALQVPKGVNRTSYGDQYFESFAEFSYMQERAKTVILAGVADAELSPRGLAVKSLRAQLVSANLLTMMGARPEQGRFFRPEETARPGSAAVVVLSHATWRTHFQGAPDVVGRTLILNRTPFTIIGVTDPKFSGPLALVPDVWIPITMQALTRPGESLVDNPNAAFVQIFSRNRPGFSDDAVKTELGVLGPQSVTAHDSGIKSRIQIVPAAFLNYPEVMGAAMPVLSIIWFIGGLVLVVTCANVANLLLARGLSRRREIAIRLAIGAGRFRLLRQMLTESLLLGFAGGGLGLLLAWQGGAAALRLIPESAGRVQLNLQPDARVLLFAFLVSLAAAIGCGLVPAFHALRVDLTPSLKSEGLLDTARSRRAWLQNALLGVQVAVSVVLLVNAGLLTQAFRRAGVLDTGKDLHGMLITFFDLRQQQFTAERAQRFHEHLAERLTAMPGIMAVSSSLLDPEISSNGSMVSIPGKNGVQGSEFRVAFDEVSPDYFRAAGIRLLAGRSFTQAEVNSREHVIVIDEQLAKKGFEGDPLGRYLDLAVGGSPTN